jgi:hypothetical protein
MFSKRLIAHTVSRISNLLIPALGKLLDYHLLDLEVFVSTIKLALQGAQKIMPEICCM